MLLAPHLHSNCQSAGKCGKIKLNRLLSGDNGGVLVENDALCCCKHRAVFRTFFDSDVTLVSIFITKNETFCKKYRYFSCYTVRLEQFV